MKKYIFLNVSFYLLILAVAYGQHPRKLLTLDDSQMTCTRTMACSVAICLWDREPAMVEHRCTFIDQTCLCPGGSICAITDRVIPGNKFITYEYRWEYSGSMPTNDSPKNI